MKMIKSLVATLFLCGSLSVACAPAFAGKPFVVGDIIDTGGYCTGEDLEFMRAFTSYMERDGMAAYWAVMQAPETPCLDTRIYGNSELITAKLVEKLWDFQIANSIKLTLWKVQDANGTFGYMWTVPNDGGT